MFRTPDKRLTAACGLFCPSCPIYIWSKKDPAKLQVMAERLQCSIEDLECEGCRSEKRCSVSCRNCKVLTCATNQGLDFCGECSKYPCDDLKAFQEKMPNRIELWGSQDRIREVGWENWYMEMLEHYSCNQCGTLNAAPDIACRTCGSSPSCNYVRIHKDEILQRMAKAKKTLENKLF